mgnify:CR=1 FL=1
MESDVTHLIWRSNVSERTNLRAPVLYYTPSNHGEGTMLKATLDIASEIAHDLNVSRELVWEILKGRKFTSREQMEIEVCKALAQLV